MARLSRLWRRPRWQDAVWSAKAGGVILAAAAAYSAYDMMAVSSRAGTSCDDICPLEMQQESLLVNMANLCFFSAIPAPHGPFKRDMSYTYFSL